MPLLVRAFFGDPHTLYRQGLVSLLLELPMQRSRDLAQIAFQSFTAHAVHSRTAIAPDHCPCRQLQVVHFPDLINQTMPFSSCDSSFEGCQHAFCPDRVAPQRELACSRPVRADRFRHLCHFGRLGLARSFHPAFAFLPPFAHTAFPCSNATMKALTAALLPSSTSAALNGSSDELSRPAHSFHPCLPASPHSDVLSGGSQSPRGSASPFLRW